MDTPNDSPALLTALAPPGGERLDVFVAGMVPGTRREDAGRWVREGRVGVEGRAIKPSMRLHAGDRVTVIPPAPRAAEAEPEDLPLPLVHREAWGVVVDKPAGMATHPGPGWWSGSALNALLHHVRDWRPINGVATPGIVHRLDRDTAGLLVFANGEAAHQALLTAMRERRIVRAYLARVRGRLEGEGTISLALDRDPADPQRVVPTPDGQAAVTHWRALAHDQESTLLEARLETGRTHQVRVHMASLGHPVLGDPWYGAGEPGGMRLHAYRLAFDDPGSGAPLAFLSWPDWVGAVEQEQIIKCGLKLL